MSVEELTREYQRQIANPPRCFDRPQDIMAFIEEEKPSKTVKVTLDLTVFYVKEKEPCWHIFLIAKSDDNFDERKRLLEGLDEDSRAKYIFCLALWKAKKQSRNRVSGTDFVPGRSYVFAYVKDLDIYYGVAQGSLQASTAVLEESSEDQLGESLDEPRAKQKRKITPKLPG